MAIVPKRKISKQRKRKRRSHHSLKVPILSKKNDQKVPHRLVKFYQRDDLNKK